MDSLIKTLVNSCRDTNVLAFADDVKLISENPNELQSALKLIEHWTNHWQLIIQPSKSEHLSFNYGSQSPTHTYTINNNSINTVNSVKDLGLHISSNLKWDTYLQSIKFKSERVAHLILRTFKTLDLNTYTKAYITYVRPLLEYNTPIWSPHLIYQVKLIESVQENIHKKSF